jgi:hypothetical protein
VTAENGTADGPTEGMTAAPGGSELERRSRRTRNYCDMWGMKLAPTVELQTLVAQGVALHTTEAVRLRALVETLMALKGQGLTQHEVFAFADAYTLWDAFTVEENDMVLERTVPPAQLIQLAWRFERVNVFGWALGKVRHLHFADHVVDSGELMKHLLPALASSVGASVVALRPEKELLDFADIHLALRAICHPDAITGAFPGNLHPGVVHERATAFDWLLHRDATP